MFVSLVTLPSLMLDPLPHVYHPFGYCELIQVIGQRFWDTVQVNLTLPKQKLTTICNLVCFSIPNLFSHF